MFKPTLAQKYLIELLMWNHLTCTNNSVKLTGMFGRFEVRNLSEGILSTSLPEGSSSSDAAQNSDCENRAKQETSLLKTAWWFLG